MKEFNPEDCQGCGKVMNNAAGGYCYECSIDQYADDEADAKFEASRDMAKEDGEEE